MIRVHDEVVRIIAVPKFERNTKVAVAVEAAYNRRRKRIKKESLFHMFIRDILSLILR